MQLRVVLVDDSPTVRAVLRRVLKRAPDIEVAGEAGNGNEAVEMVVRLRPDVILMDIQMPVADGYEATERIMALCPTPIVVVSARASLDKMKTVFEAMRRGAVEVLAKPEDTAGWDAMAQTLPETIRNVARARTRPRPVKPGAAVVPAELEQRTIRFLAIGASTGGPQAIHALLQACPTSLPAAVLIVQHIAAGFEAAFAEWLANDLRRDVRAATDGELAQPGTVRIAPPGAHLVLAPNSVLHLDRNSGPHGGHRPSADVLFSSCARVCPHEVVGVLLSGMGRDGAEGLAALRRAGGLTMVQDEASSVVFGMPGTALSRGAAEIALPPAELGRLLARHWRENDS